MNNFFFFFFFLCSLCFSQIKTQQDLQSAKPPLVFFSDDTILAVPFSSNNINFLTKHPISSWYNFKSNKIDFENYISNNNHLEIFTFIDNNIFSYGYPKKNGYIHIGLSHHIYANMELKNNLLNLIWNGNSEYLNQSVNFSGNTLSLLQYTSLYLQYSFNLNQLKIGARLNFLHGINNFNLRKSFFNLNSVNNLETPFSTYISTDIYARSGSAKLIGFSNPGLSIDYSVNYNLSKFDFSLSFENIGFIFFNKNAFHHSSNTNYLFNGFNYSMDQIISEEIENTLDTLSNTFAIGNNIEDSYVRRLPLNFSMESSFETNLNSDIFISIQCFEQIDSDDKLSFFNMYYFGYSRKINENILMTSSYNYNKYSPINLNLGVIFNYNNLRVKLNANNLTAILGGRYYHLSTAIFYIF